MKKILVRLCLAAVGSLTAVSVASAQALPNGDLETWVDRNNTLAPTGWFTVDDALIAAGFPIPAGTTSRSADKHTGQYAARLENKINPFLGVTFPGLLALGTNADLTVDFPGGIPFTRRAARMEFYYKLSGASAATEMAGAQVVLTRWNGTESVVVAAGAEELVPVADYTLKTVVLDYQSNAAPDSIRILFVSSTKDAPTVGSVLLIDDVVMAGTTTATIDAARNAAVTVYPNPSANGLFMLSAAREASWTRAAYTVSDVTGRVLVRQAAAPANTSGPRPVDLRNQKAGVYTLRLETPEGPVVHKLLIP